MTFAAVILAGGKSRRMGCDKAELIWKNMPLWQYQKTIAEDIGCKPVLVARNQDGFLQDSTDYSYFGPLAGFEAAFKKLQNTDCEYLLCLPVDMPLVTTQMLKFLIKNIETTPYEVITYKDQVFPLILHISVYDKLIAYLKHKRSVKGFIEILSHLEISSQLTDDFRNTNTSEEWHTLSTLRVF